MQIRMYAILSRAQLAAATERYPDPDTVYIDGVDLETAQPFQASSRVLSEAVLHPILRVQVVVEGAAIVRPRVGGGLNLQLEDCRITPVEEYQARVAKKTT